MATCKIRNISTPSHLTRAADYAINEEKTVETADGRMDRSIDYAVDGEKTAGQRYVSAINCAPETAAEKMAETKRLFEKTGGRLGYHIIQSFKPGEITPELAHEIGVKYAEKYLRNFEVVIGTHTDRSHVHNHMVFNSVSCVDGRKFHISRGDFYRDLRGISDQLCQEYGLSIVKYVHDKERPFAPNQVELSNPMQSHRTIIKNDIEYCIARSQSVGDLYMQLENMGYTLSLNGAHPLIRRGGGNRFMRMDGKRLGYSYDVLKSRIEQSTPPTGVMKPLRPTAYTKRRRIKPQKLTRYKAMYLHYLYVLGKANKNRAYSRIDPEEYRKFNKYKAQLAFIAKNEIGQADDISKRLAELDKQIKRLDAARFKLMGAKKKLKPVFDAHALYVRYQIQEIKTDQQKAELDKAIKVMEKNGYGGKLDAIADTRRSLLDGIASNKREVQRLKAECRMCYCQVKFPTLRQTKIPTFQFKIYPA